MWLEVRGARGEFQFTRLNAAEFIFDLLTEVNLIRRQGDLGERPRKQHVDLEALIAASLIIAIEGKTHEGF